jgi:hypothetical protein
LSRMRRNGNRIRYEVKMRDCLLDSCEIIDGLFICDEFIEEGSRNVLRNYMAMWTRKIKEIERTINE